MLKLFGSVRRLIFWLFANMPEIDDALLNIIQQQEEMIALLELRLKNAMVFIDLFKKEKENVKKD